MKDNTNALRRRLVAAGAGALATAGLGGLSRAARAQGQSVELPFVKNRLVTPDTSTTRPSEKVMVAPPATTLVNVASSVS